MTTSLEASLKLRDQFTSVLQQVDKSMQNATKTMQDFKQKVAGPAQAMNQMAQSAAASVNKLNSSIKSGMEKASNVVKSTTERILSNFGNFGNRISGKLNLSDVTNKFSSAFSTIQSKVSSGVSAVGNVLSSLKNKISGPFNAAVSIVKNGTTKIKNFLKQSGNAFKEFGNDAKTGMSKIESAFSPLGTFLKAGAVAGGAALVGLGKKIYDIAGGFEAQMSRVKAISGATGEAFKQMREQAIDLGAKTSFDADDAALGMENLASAGFNAQEIMAAMPGLLDLAAVSGGDVALASENAGTALRGFGLDASQAGHVADVFARAAADTNAEVADMGEAMKYVAPVANSMGLSIEEVAASIGIMSDAGIKGSQAGTTLRGALARLAKPTKPMLETMNALGLSFYDANGQMKPLTEQVGMLQNAFKDLTPEQQQNALVSLYGQESLSGMMALVAKGPDALGKLTESLKNSSGAAEEMANIMQDNLPAKMEQLSGSIKSGFIRIGDEIFPIVGPIIEKLTKFIADKLSKDNIGQFFDKLEKYGSVLKSAFDDVKGPVSDAIGAVGDSLKKLTGGFGSQKNIDGFKSFVSGVTDGIKKLAAFAEKHADSIAKLISLMPKIIGAFIGFKVGKGILTPFLNFGSGILTLTKGFGKLGGGLGKAIGGLFKKLPGGDKPLPVPGGGDPAKALSPLQTFLGTMNSFAKGATNLALVFGVVKIIEELAQALQDVNNKVPSDLSKLAPKLLNMGIALTGMGAFVKLAEKFSKDTKGAVRGLAVVAGISGNLMIAAVAMQQINSRVPDNIGNFASKMANMGIAIGGMGLLVLAAGKLSSMNPTGAIAGLAVVAGISLNLMIAAEAMKQVDEKVPDDIGNFASKVANMAIAIGGMGILVGAVGALMATGIGAIIGGAGLLAVAALAGEMMLVAEAISQMDAKVPDDLSSVKTKVDNIAQTISYFTEANLGTVMDLFSNAVGNLNISVVTTGIRKMQTLSDELKNFKPEIPSDYKTKISKVEEAIAALGNSKISELIGHMVTNWDYSVVTSMVEKLIKIGNSLVKLQDVNFSATQVVGIVQAINSVLLSLGGEDGFWSKIGSLFTKSMDNSLLDSALTSVNAIIKLANKAVELSSITFSATQAVSVVQAVNSVVNALGGDGGFFSKIKDYFGRGIDNSLLSSAIESIGIMIKLGNKIIELSGVNFSVTQTVSTIQAVNSVLRELGTSSISEWLGTMAKSSQLREAVSTIDTLVELVPKINQLASTEVQSLQATTIIQGIRNVLNELATLNGASISISIGGFDSLAVSMNAVSSSGQGLINVLAQLQQVQENLLSTTQEISAQIVGITSSTTSQIQTLVQGAMSILVSVYNSGMSQALSVIIGGNIKIANSFSGLRGQLQSAGYYAMAGLASGIASGSAGAIAQARAVANQVSSTIRSALKIHSPSRVMMELGGFVGKGLAKGIEMTKGLVSSASNTLASVSVPQPLGALEGGAVTSHLQLDDEEVSRLKASASQQVIVKNKQLSPQITINIDNKDGQPIDTEELLQEFEDKLVELIDADLS